MRETREVDDSSGGAYLFFFAIYRARALRVALLLQQQRQLEEADKDEPVVACVSCPRDGEVQSSQFEMFSSANACLRSFCFERLSHSHGGQNSCLT